MRETRMYKRLAAGMLILLVVPAAVGVFLLSGMITMRLGAPEPWFAIACFVGVALWGLALCAWYRTLVRSMDELMVDGEEGERP